MARMATKYFMRASLRWLRCVVRRGGSLGDPLEQVAGLALQHPAHRLEGGEPDRLGAAVLQHRDVAGGEPDALREVPTLSFRCASCTSILTTMGIR